MAKTRVHQVDVSDVVDRLGLMGYELTPVQAGNVPLAIQAVYDNNRWKRDRDNPKLSKLKSHSLAEARKAFPDPYLWPAILRAISELMN